MHGITKDQLGGVRLSHFKDTMPLFHRVSRTVYARDLHETAPIIAIVTIPVLTVIVITRGPHTTILLQHHAKDVCSLHGLNAARDHLGEG